MPAYSVSGMVSHMIALFRMQWLLTKEIGMRSVSELFFYNLLGVRPVSEMLEYNCKLLGVRPVSELLEHNCKLLEMRPVSELLEYNCKECGAKVPSVSKMFLKQFAMRSVLGILLY